MEHGELRHPIVFRDVAATHGEIQLAVHFCAKIGIMFFVGIPQPHDAVSDVLIVTALHQQQVPDEVIVRLPFIVLSVVVKVLATSGPLKVSGK